MAADSNAETMEDERLAIVDHELCQDQAEFVAAIDDSPATLKDVHHAFTSWLELDGDLDFIDVVLAASIDRALPGEPVWLFVIANSGGTKTETLRTLSSLPFAYSLDSLTGHTIISGKVELDEERQLRPIKGILPSIDNHVLVIKDFTIILSKRVEERDEIFSQLRGLHDGYLEFAFGTLREPIRIKANIGLIAGTTPIIDIYGKLSGILGERFLKIRHTVDSGKVGHRAVSNLGKEPKMRRELSAVVSRFLTNLKVTDYSFSSKTADFIVSLAKATAILRTPVLMKFWRFEVTEASTPSIEYPTRLSKQLLKLGKLLANLRGHHR